MKLNRQARIRIPGSIVPRGTFRGLTTAGKLFHVEHSEFWSSQDKLFHVEHSRRPEDFHCNASFEWFAARIPRLT